jgi:eukaryotic-like serine/threonine-protein kinase
MTAIVPAELSSALAKSYRIERELGAGGMATVYLARDLKHDRDVAIKVLRPDIGAALGAERFLREIKTTANLRHPHIVPLYDSGEVHLDGAATDGSPQPLYYVMPVLEGESLRDRLAREGQLPIDTALRIAREVAEALAHAHARGVIHRDIKPDNIYIENGHAVVADFGIARAVIVAGGERITQTGMSVGTPLYMSPEQAAGENDLDARSDQYSLACVLYEMLAGQPPFTGPNAMAIARQHLIAAAPPITNLRAGVPATVAAALARGLAKTPADRFEQMSQFAMALSAGANASPSSRHTRTRTVGVAGVAAVAIAALSLLMWRRHADVQATEGYSLASIAVLPFADLSADHTNAYLGDGVAETLINALVNVPGLVVAARASAFSVRGREGDVREIGKQLHVSNVLEGSVQRAGDMLRITAQLIRAADGVTVWSQRFDRQTAEIFAVQDEVARSAVSAMRLTISSNSDSDGGRGSTRNPAAYEAYLLGRYHWNLRTTEGMIHATEAFKRAIALDSSYALAWAGLADAYSLSTPNEYNVPGLSADSLLTLAERAARRASVLAPRLGEVLASLGQVLETRHRWSEAAAAYEQAIQLSPSYPTAHQWYSYYLTFHNRWDESIREMETAHRLDPLSHVITLSLAVAYDGADRFDEATPLYAQGLAQSPEAWYAWKLRIGHELALGHIDAAAVALRRFQMSQGDDSANAARVERGVRNAATRGATIDELEHWRDVTPAIAFTRWFRGDEATIALLERIATRADRPTTTLFMNPVLGPRLRANPRVQALAPKFGGPPSR